MSTLSLKPALSYIKINFENIYSYLSSELNTLYTNSYNQLYYVSSSDSLSDEYLSDVENGFNTSAINNPDNPDNKESWGHYVDFIDSEL